IAGDVSTILCVAPLLERSQFLQQCHADRALATIHVVHVVRDRDGGNDAYDRYRHHQFDQRESVLMSLTHWYFSGMICQLWRPLVLGSSPIAVGSYAPSLPKTRLPGASVKPPRAGKRMPETTSLLYSSFVSTIWSAFRSITLKRVRPPE